MKKMLGLLFLFKCTFLFSMENVNDLLQELDAKLAKRAIYEQIKEDRIDSLKQLLWNPTSISNQQKFDIYESLFAGYKLYQYDSAFTYAQLLNQLAHKIQLPAAIAQSRSELGLILEARGLFKEAMDTLDLVDVTRLNPPDKLNYYRNRIKLYFDLEHYTNDRYYSPFYKNKALNYCDSVILDDTPESYQRKVHVALKKMVTGSYNQSIPMYLEVLHNYETTLHEQAQYNATLGFLYKITGDKNQSITYLVKASMADIEANIKETTALRGLAEMLFEMGNVEKAYQYILIAKQDAEFYGTKHRLLEISSILPHIEGAYLNMIDSKRKQMLKSVVLIASLSLLVMIFLALTLVQISRLRKARKIILEKHETLENLNTNLRESNIIKEEYIGYYFNISSQYIDKLEKLKKNIDRQISTRQFDTIQLSLRDVDPKEERAKLFENFDTIFLSIFPGFVRDYNNLFHSDDRVQEKGAALSTPQRIFALMRIGVQDNEKIARILNFSVNTIYTYKTKEKNKSLIANDAFEQCIMQIKSE